MAPKRITEIEILGVGHQGVGIPQAAHGDTDVLAADRALDDGRRGHDVLEHDGELAADGAAGERGEATEAVVAEGEIDFGAVGGRVPSDLGVGDVAAVELDACEEVVAAPAACAVAIEASEGDRAVGRQRRRALVEDALDRRTLGRAHEEVAVCRAAFALRPAVAIEGGAFDDGARRQVVHDHAATVVDELERELATARELAGGTLGVDAAR